MNVIMTESEPAQSATLAAELAKLGHTVTTCAAPRGSTAPCAGMLPCPACPLDTAELTLVVDVRANALPRLTDQEYGAVCALREDVPVLVVGPAQAGAAAPWAAATVPDTEAVSWVCTYAQAGPRTTAERVDRAVERTLSSRFTDGAGATEFDQDHGRRIVVVRLDHQVNPALTRAIVRAVRTALRHDPEWREADVEIRSRVPLS